MSDKKESAKTTLQGLDPVKPFYLAASVGNLDGSIDYPEGVEGVFVTEAEAIAKLKEVNDEYPTLDGYVYYCVPVKHVWRGKTKVTPIKAKSLAERSKP